MINAGSSSLKFKLFNIDTEKEIISGFYDSINVIGNECVRKIKYNSNKEKISLNISDHKDAVDDLLNYLLNNDIIDNLKDIKLIAHRVVHGGDKYNSTVEINSGVLQTLENMSFLAPLHNPSNINCIKIIQERLPESRNFAIFDTAFHSTMSKEVYLYALPLELYNKYKIRKYGFHGISHKFVSKEACNILNKDISNSKIITCHLGNGQSICAIKDGKSIDNSMGFTPLEGLPMGTRSGSFDPEIILFLLEKGYTKESIKKIINKQSGLLGVTEKTSDHRFIEEQAIKGKADCLLANNMLVNRITKIIGSYISELKGLDVLVFTGGIGEKSSYLRKLILQHFNFLGLEIDNIKNNHNKLIISTSNSKIKVLVVPTNEELQMIRDVKEII